MTKNFSDEEINEGKYMWRSTHDVVSECKLYYNLMFVCSENPLSDRFVKLYLSTYDNEGVKFLFF